MTTIAEIKLWGRTIGAVSLGDERELATFEYDTDFSNSGIEVSPITMPLSTRIYRFLNYRETLLRIARFVGRFAAG